VASLQNIADIAATSIDQTRQLQQQRQLVHQLQNALNSRVVLEQAKGVIAERMKTDFPSAFAELRSLARNAQRPIHHVAEEIVSRVCNSSAMAPSRTVA
jgi:AmiR/NasT family two-component response regulator